MPPAPPEAGQENEQLDEPLAGEAEEPQATKYVPKMQPQPKWKPERRSQLPDSEAQEPQAACTPDGVPPPSGDHEEPPPLDVPPPQQTAKDEKPQMDDPQQTDDDEAPEFSPLAEEEPVEPLAVPECPWQAAAAGCEKTLPNGQRPCAGFQGYRCPARAPLAAGKSYKRCKPCRRLENAKLPARTPDPWASMAHIPTEPMKPLQRPPAPRGSVGTDTAKDHRLEAAETVARKFAERGEEGFRHLLERDHSVPEKNWQKDWTLPEKALYRLTLLADRYMFPKDTIQKPASHCGGIAPYEPWLQEWNGFPGWADPGNPAYNAVVSRLEKECSPWRHHHFYTGWTTKDELGSYDCKTELELMVKRLGFLRQRNAEHRADCIEAALAAADFPFKHEHKLAWRYEDLQGGVWGTGDIPSSLSI